MIYEIPDVGFINLNHVHMVTHPKKTKNDWQGITWSFFIHVGVTSYEVKAAAGIYSSKQYKAPEEVEAHIRELHKGVIDALYVTQPKGVSGLQVGPIDIVQYPELEKEEEDDDDSKDWGMRMSD